MVVSRQHVVEAFRFSLGMVVKTVGVDDAIPDPEILSALQRHATGDWGDLEEDDKLLNDQAVMVGDRILSKYRAENGTDFYIITEWDRSCTTVLLPSEY